MEMLRGFKEFILKGNVVDLAVGIVIGSAFSALVSSFTKDLLTPLIGAVYGQESLVNLYFTLHNSRFNYGDFINALIAFLLTAMVLYFLVVLPTNKFMEITRLRSTTRSASTKKCPFCFMEIPVQATKCPECTSELDKNKKK
jgi:large conductance mechanosensitive channel